MHTIEKQRGSQKVLAAWQARTLTEEAVREIGTNFEKSPATIERAEVIGGSSPTGLRLSLRYDGDDVPWCGNDITFWLKWLHKVGGSVHPPRIIINGIPHPEWLRLELEFGNVAGNVAQGIDVAGLRNGGGLGG